ENLELHDISETVKKYIYESCYAEQIGIVLFPEKNPSLFQILKGSTKFFDTVKGKKFVTYVYNKMMKETQASVYGNFNSREIKIPFASLILIPIQFSESVFGAIIIADRTPYYFSFEKYKFIQSFIQHASLAFFNSILKEKLKKTAITDYLTKLYSR